MQIIQTSKGHIAQQEAGDDKLTDEQIAAIIAGRNIDVVSGDKVFVERLRPYFMTSENVLPHEKL